MKCSHGLPYEVKCAGCLQDANARIGLMMPKAPPAMKMYADQNKNNQPGKCDKK